MKQKEHIANETLSDAKIFEQIARKDVSALSTLYDRYSGRLFGLALKILKDQSLAEDMVQELFLYLWENADKFDRYRGDPIGWMMVVCRNRCIDKLRAKTTNFKRSAVINEETLQKIAADESESPLEIVKHKEIQRNINRALEQLPDEQRVPIELAYFEGLSQTEISKKLKLPLGTIKTRVRLGMQKLRSIFMN